MRSSAIVVANPLAKNPFYMTFAEWNQEVQAFSSNRSDQPFTERVGLGCSDRRLQNTNAEAFQRGVQVRGEDSIAVVDDVPVGMIEGEELAELLSAPLSSRMLGDVAMQDPARSNFHGDQDVQDAKARRDGNEVVASDNGGCMIPNESGPTVDGASAWPATFQILGDCSRRDSDA